MWQSETTKNQTGNTDRWIEQSCHVGLVAVESKSILADPEEKKHLVIPLHENFLKCPYYAVFIDEIINAVIVMILSICRQLYSSI